MFPLKSIVCPVDFSEASRDALRWAMALAGRDRATLRVLSVIEPIVTEAGAIAYDLDSLEAATSQSLIDFVKKTAPSGAAWWSEPLLEIRIGVPWVEIIELGELAKAELIVMGTHGFGGVRKAFFGSTTERVLRRTPVPVLAVPPGAPPVIELNAVSPAFMFGRIVCPVDFGPDTDRQADTAAQLARTFGVPLVLLHVVADVREHALLAPQRDTRDRLRRAQATHQLEALAARLSPMVALESSLRHGHPAEEIAVAVSERQAGLVVMGLHGQSGLFGARPGSIAYRVMCQSKVPVLALPPLVRQRVEEGIAEATPAAVLI
jgi:nucleotide-binding universal stress UspA family protein